MTRASSSSASGRMARQATRDTLPELRLRKELHRRGLRYRVHARPLASSSRRVVDIAFVRERVAVDVRGCFWHACPDHASWPASNAAWWEAKLLTNQRRDAETQRLLESDGWLVVVVWEHEDALEAADRVEQAVRSRR